MRKWKCTVCGYIHIGDEPPDECPVCGADRSDFVEITGVIEASETAEAEMLGEEPAGIETAGSAPVSVEPNDTAQVTLFDKLTDLMLEKHMHPIAVQLPPTVLSLRLLFSCCWPMFSM